MEIGFRLVFGKFEILRKCVILIRRSCSMIDLRYARLDEKKVCYEWLCESDTTRCHMGPPDYPEIPIPTWEEFQDDFEDFYFKEEGRALGAVLMIQSDSEIIGCICYASFHLRPGSAELDIWFKSLDVCGKGQGPQAIRLLMERLSHERGIRRFLIRPSEKNIRAIRAYEKAGFTRARDKQVAVESFLLEEFSERYGAGDYGWENTAVLVCEADL